MSRKAGYALLLLTGLILTLAPPIYLSMKTYSTLRPVANETFTFSGAAGILSTFHGEKGDILVLVVTNNATKNGSTLVVRLQSARDGKIILQDKIDGGDQKSYRIALPITSDYSLYILNPLNKTSTGLLVGAIRRQVPLYESPSASTLMIVSVIGAILLGFAAGYKPCNE